MITPFTQIIQCAGEFIKTTSDSRDTPLRYGSLWDVTEESIVVADDVSWLPVMCWLVGQNCTVQWIKARSTTIEVKI